MGLGMAGNLARLLKSQQAPASLARKELFVYNRTASKAQPLTSHPDLSIQLAASPAEVAASCSIMCLMLADDVACDSMLQQLQQCDLQGKVIVNHSTNTPEFAMAAVAQLRGKGCEYIAAPVWGRPDAAAAARLIVVPAGPAEAVARVQPFLAAHGRLLPTQDAAHKANAMKLIGNFTLFGFVETMCEALTLADKNSIPREDMLAFVDAFFPAPSIQGYARRIASESLDAGAGFTVDLALKDVRYMRQLAEMSRCPLRVADLVFNSLLAASANGYGLKDVGAMFLTSQQAAGILPPGKHLDEEQEERS
uniref:6-phosphogluconate dehydrogenase NADP-binding domain-containing protein n=1 Tax=Tetradesmus obliquus TaxID=3088 RepID=A0A383VVZ5_TETOB|eukprot:jgi/Sobl393_1/16648/SZX68962.1